MKKQQGLNLLEVLVAAFLISLGLLGMAGLQVKSFRATHNSYQMQQATQLAHELLERMRSNRTAVLTGKYTVNAVAATYCADPLAFSCQTNTCNSTQMATDDIYHVICGYGTGTGINGALLNGQLTVDCPDPSADCAKGIRLSLQWNERNASKNEADVEPFNLILNTVL
ncbi:MAG: type IV pilus modification protein PilV [Thiothrix sp.]|nr:MAG: type IV pilus modification protein PilV [Thiothrix sp.]